MKKQKLAVILPGLGYHCDKPLLYYTKKYLKNKEYKIKEISYHNLPEWDKDSLPQIGKIVIKQAIKAFEKINQKDYEQIIFVSKSIGSLAACYLAKQTDISWKHICFTPIDETIPLLKPGKTIVFSGTKDPLVDGNNLKEICEKKKIPLYLIEGGNHSLETGEVIHDIKQLKKIMEVIAEMDIVRV